ncbi:hypothetical protein K8R33_04055 [archaeon]|nr:hypothetical protein [archaeon]
MSQEEYFKQLKKKWLEKMQNKSGIIYKYIQEELVDSFIEDLKGRGRERSSR